MTKMINVNAVASKDKDGKTVYERSLDFPVPNILQVETLADIAKSLGEDYCLHQLKAQIKISWRSKMRLLMEKKDDNGAFENSDEAILKAFDPAWTPELRVTKTPEEKALAALGALDPATRKLVMAQMAKQKG